MTRKVHTIGVLFIIVAAVLISNAAWAVTANPLPIKVNQPDGTEITIRLRGDERYNWIEDLNGYLVRKEPDGSYVYAKVENNRGIPTEWKVGQVDPQAVGLRNDVRPPRSLPAMFSNIPSLLVPPGSNDPLAAPPQRIQPPITGTVNNLVILCQFNDHDNDEENTYTLDPAYYEILFNNMGPDQDYAPTGSVKDYFTETSYGQLSFDSLVLVEWVELPENESYYTAGQSGFGLYPNNAQRMVEDALNEVEALFADGTINATDPNAEGYINLDIDEDGFIDAIDFIHSGYGAEFDGSPYKIWSHMWALNTPWVSESTGLTVQEYHTEPALFGDEFYTMYNGVDITHIGVICHETAHFFGLPDLYDTDGSSDGIGAWGLMGNSWGFLGNDYYPPHPSAWSKIFLQWVEPVVIDEGGTYIASPSQTDNTTVYKIDNGFFDDPDDPDDPNEYLLIENRQPIGFDSFIGIDVIGIDFFDYSYNWVGWPQGGLAIWHIDDSMGSFLLNNVNDNEGYPGQFGWPYNGNHYRVALLQADGNYDLEHGSLFGVGDSGDLYYPGFVDEITPSSIPNTDTYQGGIVNPTEISIDEIDWIGMPGGDMIFNYWGLSIGRVLNYTKGIEYTNIQAAIDEADEGDEIIANSNYSYQEHIDFLGKNVILRSGDVDNPTDQTVSPENTYIKGNFNGRSSVVTFQSGESNDCVLKGFTITHGFAENGGGIECVFSSPTISDCIIEGNRARSYGGGIDLWNSQAFISDCIIRDNSAWSGGGINVDSDSARIQSCQIVDNTSSEVGGGISCYYTSSTFTNCAIAENEATDAGGAVYLWASDTQIRNCTIVDNTGVVGLGGIYRDPEEPTLPTIINSIIWNNGDDLSGCSATYSCIEDVDAGTGNIHDDPLIVGPYYLSFDGGWNVGQDDDSPCFDAGSGTADQLANDLAVGFVYRDITTRTDHSQDMGTVDMGYHHYTGPVPQYTLTTAAINGTIDPDHPAGVDYDQYTIIHLEATSSLSPDVLEELIWSGTDDDTITDTTNTATMDRNRDVIALFQKVPEYMLTVSIVGTHGSVEISDPDNLENTISARRAIYYRDTVVQLIGIPDEGYRVKAWTGSDNDPSWNANSTITMTEAKTVTVEFELDISRKLLVPSVYPNVEDAVFAAKSGDSIVVSPRPSGPYFVEAVDGIDFGGKVITLTSTDPDDPEVIATTIIDASGTKNDPGRAFYFHTNEDTRSIVTGFTIRSGFTIGDLGADGVIYTGIWPPLPDEDPPPPPRALSGEDAFGDGYGGAILIEDSSPSIVNCVIENCVVMGGYGGDGDNGYYLDEDSDADAQAGGHGGDGFGNGYGGAIAILGSSDPNKCAPLLKNITFVDSIAIGGCGGNAGNASINEGSGRGNWGGAGGNAEGQGYGGAVYCSSSKPTFEDCTFTDNHAAYGVAGFAGNNAAGGTWPEPFDQFYQMPDGTLVTDGSMAGGAVYYVDNAEPLFINCSFSENSAYDVALTLEFWTSDGVLHTYVFEEQTRGGAVYVGPGLDLTMKDCTFTDNLAGAVHVVGQAGTEVDLNNCAFIANRTLQEFETSVSLDMIHQILASFWLINTDPNVAGGLFIGNDCDNINLTDCRFSDNYSHAKGGAIYTRSDIKLTGCDFGTNVAEKEGGAIEAVYNGPLNAVILKLELLNCDFSGNKGIWGGAVHARGFDADFVNCTFYNNTAQSGGALFLSDGKVSIDASCICGNNAAGYTGGFYNLDDGLGAGLACMSTTAEITNCLIQDNIADGDASYGGAVNFNGGGHLIIGELITHTMKNCLLTGNSATLGGGAIACTSNTDPQIQSCTFTDNTTDALNGAGGGLFCDWTSTAYISDCIFANCSNHAVYEEPYDADTTIKFCLFADNSDGDLYDAATGQTYTGAAVNLVGLNSDNISGDPLFITGPFGSYYLDQDQSPAVDAGSVSDPDELGFGRNYPLNYTTSPDDMPDGGIDSIDTDPLDIGYHYKTIQGAGLYQLTIIAVDAHGTFTVDLAPDPDQMYTNYTDDFYAGATVRIAAFPNDGYRVADWDGGTVQDGARVTENVVILNRDKTIYIYFDQPRTLVVGSSGEYTSIQHAIDDAVNGDTVMIQPGVYEPDTPYVDTMQYLTLNPHNKAITITSVNPDDPETVANTVLSMFRIQLFQSGSDTIFNGLTFSSRYYGLDGIDGVAAGADGFDGASIHSGVMAVYNSSPTILNCRFVDCSATGGDGGNGNGGDAGDPEGGDGGWNGRAYGGAVYCGYSSKPVFKNCSFINCRAIGGNGGNGGDGYAEAEAHGGRGGGWVFSPSMENDPEEWAWWDGWEYGDKFNFADIGYLIYDWDTWNRWFNWDNWTSWDDFDANYVHDPYDAYEEHWRYSGYGGAVYCEYDSSATFVDCEFIGNYTEGGLCGIGGNSAAIPPEPPRPERNLNIDTAGGAIYAAHDSNLKFENCQFVDNYADVTTVDIPYDYNVSLGGAVAVEKNCNVDFVDCSMRNNYAAAGGGLYWNDAKVTVTDSNFIANEAYLGAGIYTTESEGLITGTDFLQNQAHLLDQVIPGDVEFGIGGAYHGLSAQVDVVDSTFLNNQATLSGGAIMLTGGLDEEPLIKNNLFVNNQAGTTGGAISLGWNSNHIITNCTLTDNRAMGDDQIPDDGLGGGLYCAYNSQALLEYCIIWDNQADMGQAIAVDTVLGPEKDPIPSTVSVLHSAVLNGLQETAVFVDEDSTLNWDPENVTAVPAELFLSGELGNHYLNQELEDSTGQSIIVDAGPDYASALGMDRYTTSVDHIFDRGKVDMGYHYPFEVTPNACRIADVVLNGMVDLDDLVVLTQYWMAAGCTAEMWCGNSDIDRDTHVGLIDFSVLGMCWLAEDTKPPHPDPAQWEVLPHSQATGSITMQAKIAVDAWWVEDEDDEFVEYYFECDDDNPAFTRDWDPDPEYTAAGLINLEQYGFRVKARDPSGNETEFSEWAYATTGAESDPPQPDPSLWLQPPGVTGPDSIIMSAQIATDVSPPIEYYFRYTEPDGEENGQDDGHSSGWQPGNVYEDTELTFGQTYTYRVSARDFWGNVTEESVPISVTIDEWDILPPVPDPPMWEVLPTRYSHSSGYWHFMAVQPATDDSGVEYYFDCIEEGNDFDSGWQSVGGLDPDGFQVPPNVYWVYVGSKFLLYHYRVRVRDMAPEPNYTGWSTTEQVPPIY